MYNQQKIKSNQSSNSLMIYGWSLSWTFKIH